MKAEASPPPPEIKRSEAPGKDRSLLFLCGDGIVVVPIPKHRKPIRFHYDNIYFQMGVIMITVHKTIMTANAVAKRSLFFSFLLAEENLVQFSPFGLLLYQRSRQRSQGGHFHCPVKYIPDERSLHI